MNEPQTLTRAGPVATLRTHYLALLTLLILTHALQTAGGLLDGFWLGRLLGGRTASRLRPSPRACCASACRPHCRCWRWRLRRSCCQVW